MGGPSPTTDMYRVEWVELLEPHHLLIVWGDSHESVYPFRQLRAKCSCANCVDEWTGEEIVSLEKIPEDVRVTRWEATGRYGINLFFSDGHTSGIYTLKSLRDLCPCGECSE